MSNLTPVGTPTKTSRQSSGLEPEQADRLLAIQERELFLKEQQLELNKQTDKNSYNFAIANLDATKEDRREQRAAQIKLINSRYLFVGGFVGGIILLIAVFLVVAMIMGKDQIAMEVIKAALYLVSGGLGGYALRKPTPKKDDD